MRFTMLRHTQMNPERLLRASASCICFVKTTLLFRLVTGWWSLEACSDQGFFLLQWNYTFCTPELNSPQILYECAWSGRLARHPTADAQADGDRFKGTQDVDERPIVPAPDPPNEMLTRPQAPSHIRLQTQPGVNVRGETLTTTTLSGTPKRSHKMPGF